MDYCIICGAPLSEGNTTGIGSECMAALHAAKAYKAKKDGLNLKVHVYMSKLYRAKFVELYKGVKFRSAFRRNFYESMQTCERISKKQLDIMTNIMMEKYDGCSFFLEIREKVDKYEKQLIDETEVTREEIEIARNYIRNTK